MMRAHTAEKQTFTHDGHQIAYQTAGDPALPPLILVHGWLSHSGVWRQTLDAFQHDYYCVAIDLLGLADSDKPADGNYSILAQAERVLALADHLHIQRFALMGHSMGGQIAYALASLLALHRITRLVIVGGVSTGLLAWYPATVTRARIDLATNHPWMWDWSAAAARNRTVACFEFRPWFYDIEALPFESWDIDRRYALQREMHISAGRCLDAIRSFDLTPYLHQVGVPTLILFGREDAVVPLSEGERAADRVPGSQLLVYDRCGHFPMLEREADFLRDVYDFLAR